MFLTSAPRGPEIDEYAIKFLIGTIALALPALEYCLVPGGIDSISASFWYTSQLPPTHGLWARNVFVGLLFAIAGLLMTYNGRDAIEMSLTKLAALAAVLIVMFPCGAAARSARSCRMCTRRRRPPCSRCWRSSAGGSCGAPGASAASNPWRSPGGHLRGLHAGHDRGDRALRRRGDGPDRARGPDLLGGSDRPRVVRHLLADGQPLAAGHQQAAQAAVRLSGRGGQRTGGTIARARLRAKPIAQALSNCMQRTPVRRQCSSTTRHAPWQT